MSVSKEQEITERAGVLIRSIEGDQDPASLDKFFEEYNALVDQLYAIRIPNKETFVLLPTELKYKIFEEFCSSNQGGPLLLSQVCKQWHKLTLQNAELWTNVTINSRNRNWVNHLERYSSNSGQRMLDVRIHFPLAHQEIQEMAHCTDFSRWRSLSILKGRPGTESAPARMLLRASGPALLLVLLQMDSFPQLKELIVRIKSINTLSPYMWSSLFEHQGDITELPLLSSLAKSSILSHLTVNLYLTGLDELLNVLSNSPDLTHLTLSAQRHVPEHAHRPDRQTLAPLHHLRELRMKDNSLDLLLAIECPNLERLDASLSHSDIQKLRARLRDLTSLKKVSLNLRGQSVENFLRTSAHRVPLPPQERLATVVELSFNYLPGLGTNASWAVTNHEDVYQFLELFCSARHVTLMSGLDTFDWPRAVLVFPNVENLSIEQSKPDLKNRGDRYPQLLASAAIVTPARDATDLTSLRTLRIEGGCCTVFSAFSAPTLRSLALTEMKGLPLNSFLTFLSRSSALNELHLEGVYISPLISPPSSPSLAPLTLEPHPTFNTTAQDVQITHDALPILQHLSLPSLSTLRLMGVLQGVTVQRANHHFDQREIHLSTLLDLPDNLLRNIHTLDLCVYNVLFPIVTGFTEVLPHLPSLKSISLPRALHATNVLVDALIQELLGENGETYRCPRLTDIRTEDYPKWDGLMDLLAQRNRTAHIKRDDQSGKCAPVPVESLHLPGLPHSSILVRLQLALAGKFPPRKDVVLAHNITVLGCDDCVLAGWNCVEPGVLKGAQVRSSCNRHRDGPVRVSADS